MIDLNNESGVAVDEQRLIQLALFVLDQMRIHPQAELSIVLVDENTMAEYHERFLGLPGPTDVLSFPMDELRPPRDGEEPRWVCWATSSCAPPSRLPKPPRTTGRPRAKPTTCWCMASCTCWATTTPNRRRRRSCSASTIA